MSNILYLRHANQDRFKIFPWDDEPRLCSKRTTKKVAGDEWVKYRWYDSSGIYFLLVEISPPIFYLTRLCPVSLGFVILLLPSTYSMQSLLEFPVFRFESSLQYCSSSPSPHLSLPFLTSTLAGGWDGGWGNIYRTWIRCWNTPWRFIQSCGINFISLHSLQNHSDLFLNSSVLRSVTLLLRQWTALYRN